TTYTRQCLNRGCSNRGASAIAELGLAETSSVNTIKDLKALNGYLPDGSLYLPWGADQDAHKDYMPTVLPRPIGGGYLGIFFSRRASGHTVGPGGSPLNIADPAQPVRKKVWVAAIDLDHETKTDPSHPAFFVPGQKLEYESQRPFVSLEPCQPQGASCESGADCCSGFCRE